MTLDFVMHVAVCIVVCELVLRLPITRICARMAGIGRESSRVLLSRRISDHWKERIMPVHARHMGASTAILAACFAVIGLVAVLLVKGGEMLRPGFETLLVSATGIALSCVISCAYLAARRFALRKRA